MPFKDFIVGSLMLLVYQMSLLWSINSPLPREWKMMISVQRDDQVIICHPDWWPSLHLPYIAFTLAWSIHFRYLDIGMTLLHFKLVEMKILKNRQVSTLGHILVSSPSIMAIEYSLLVLFTGWAYLWWKIGGSSWFSIICRHGEHCEEFESDNGNWCGAVSFNVTACYSYHGYISR